jgi:hypothetical protein
LVGSALNYSSIDEILKTRFMFMKGIDSPLITPLNTPYGVNTISDYFALGGEREDDGYAGSWTGSLLNSGINGLTTRGWHHFHDPLREWGNAGLSNLGAVLAWRGNTNLEWPYPSLIWGLSPEVQRTPTTLYTITGDWSWGMARQYFFDALTASDKHISRDEAWANCFRSLGQIMHLVQDAAVPDHTRNDPHTGKDYERYLIRVVKNTPDYFKRFTPIFPDDQILKNPNPDSLYSDIVPISGLIDRNQYIGGDIPENDRLMGLAEFTNANFFSNDTIFTYPHPHIHDIVAAGDDRMSLFEEESEDFGRDKRLYYSKVVGEHTGHLVAAAFYYSFFENPLGYQLTYLLDEKCYEDYAYSLIPRAIGYSSRVIDYFFRGELELSAPESGVYSIIDGAVTHYDDNGQPIYNEFNKIRLVVKNKTTDEFVSAGKLVAVARFKKRLSYKNDLTYDPPNTDAREAGYYQSASYTVELSSTMVEELNSSSGCAITFEFPPDTFDPSGTLIRFGGIPQDITDLQLFVVFQGTLGQEVNTAIAVGRKDLSEPTHICVFNDTDRFFVDHQIKTSDEIRGNQYLSSFVDNDGDGVYNEPGEPYINPVNLNTYVSFFKTTPPESENVEFVNLPPGGYGRIIVLTDDELVNLRIRRQSVFNQFSPLETLFQIKGIQYQDEYDENGIFLNFFRDIVLVHRNIINHKWFACIQFAPDAFGITMAPWPEHPLFVDPTPATAIRP